MSVTVELALGAGGAYVDVSAFILGTEGITRTYGRTSPFQDPNPGTCTFTLENQVPPANWSGQGRFTPGGPGYYGSRLIEGIGALYRIDGMTVQGIVTAIVPTGTSEDQWGRVSITCQDVLVLTSRITIDDLAADVGLSTAWAYARCTDAGPAINQAGSLFAATPNAPHPAQIQPSPRAAKFGVSMSGISGDNGVTLTPTAYASQTLAAVTVGVAESIGSIPGAVPGWLAAGCHFQLADSTGTLWMVPDVTASATPTSLEIGFSAGSVTVNQQSASGSTQVAAANVNIVPGATYYAHAMISQQQSPANSVTVEVYLNGVPVLTASVTLGAAPNFYAQAVFAAQADYLAASNTASGSVTVRHLYVGNESPNEYVADTCQWGARFNALQALAGFSTPFHI